MTEFLQQSEETVGMTSNGCTPYPSMKDSGVPWLGDVPEHWVVERLKGHLVRNDSGVWVDDSDPTGTVVLRSTEQTVNGGWRINNPATLRLSGAQRAAALLASGDLVVTKSSGSSAHIGKTSLVSMEIARLRCCFSNFMQRLRPDAKTDPAFLWRTLNCPVGREQLVFQSTTTTGLGNLNGTILGNCRFTFPPLPEQAAIVRYLDYVDRRVRRLVRAKQKLIGLLEEQKQAIIHHAVTRGLDPDVALKDSGVEWLGKVPAHWEVRRVKTLFRLRIEKSGIGHGKELLSIYTHIGVRPRKDLEEKGNKASTTDDYWTVQKGDIICNKLLAWMGAIGVSHFEGVTSPAYDILMPVIELSPDYYHYLFRTKRCLQEFKQRSRGIMDMRLRLYFDQFGQILVPFPPPKEQCAIIDYYDQATASIDTAITRAKREIDLLNEYRTRLIADVVTGKLDVREAAAKLPEEPEPRDEPEDLADEEEAGEANSFAEEMAA